jgi:hypothetical protein
MACLVCTIAGFALAEGEDAGYIYGSVPTSGSILLKLVNNEDSLDIVAVITKGGEKTPILAVYIPSDDVGSIKKMPSGRYDIYFTTGVDWNEKKFYFNDGMYYKLKSPLILGEKSEYKVQLYSDPGKMGARMKQIDASVFPDISGAAPPSGSDGDSEAGTTQLVPPPKKQ